MVVNSKLFLMGPENVPVFSWNQMAWLCFYLLRWFDWVGYAYPMILRFLFLLIFVNTVKALLSPWGAYLILDTPQGGLIREGAYSKS